MRTLLLNLTASLDGFIADEHGGIDWWLPPADEPPREYLELIEPAAARTWSDGIVELRYRRRGGNQ